jgi:anti-sigma factor RsiW
MDNYYFFNTQLKLPMHSFTPEDLLQYLYKETSQEKTSAIKAALETDFALREKLEVIQNGQQRLEKLNLSPRQEAVDSILKYAEKSVKELSSEV